MNPKEQCQPLFEGYREFLGETGAEFGQNTEVRARLTNQGVAISGLLSWFLDHALPRTSLDIGDGIRVYGGLRFVGENLGASPSMYLFRLGLWTIARDPGGDALVIAEQGPAAVWMSPEYFSGKSAKDVRILGTPAAGSFLESLARASELPAHAMFSDRYRSAQEALRSRV
jgi:hypothetical protein